MKNDFQLEGVKELFSKKGGVVEGYELPNYDEASITMLERKGFASTLAR